MKTILELLFNEGEEYKLFISYSFCSSRPSHVNQDHVLILGLLRDSYFHVVPAFSLLLALIFSYSLDVFLNFTTLAVKSQKRKETL